MAVRQNAAARQARPTILSDHRGSAECERPLGTAAGNPKLPAVQNVQTASGLKLPFADLLRACLAPGAFPPADHGCMSRTSGAKRS
jgi:hypothetical protein